MTALAKPGLLQTVVDAEFGTTIRRITQVAATGSNPVIKPLYSTISAWNADESYLLLYQVQTGDHLLYDGRTYQFIRTLDISPPDLEQVYWHTSDPDILFYVSGKTLIRYHVSTGQKESLTTFSFCSSGASGGDDPMFMSWDSNRIGLRCGSEVFIYDIPTNTVVGRKSLNQNPAQVSPSGTLAYLSDVGDVTDTSLNVLRRLDLREPYGHAGLGQYANGHDTWNGAVYDNGPNGNDDIGTLVTFDLTNATSKVVIGPKTGWPYPNDGHISTMALQHPGWVFVSTFGKTSGAGLMDIENLIADTNTGKVCRIGRHRSWGKANTKLAEPYWAEAHTVPSPSGTRAVFASDWGNGSTVDAYVVELPGYGGGARDGDLSLTASASPNPVGASANLTYTFTVRNEGSTTVAGVTLDVTLPAGSPFVSAPSGCVNTSGSVSCALNSLAGQSSRAIAIVVSADTVGTALAQGAVSAGSPDPNPSNNTASIGVPVLPTLAIGDVALTEGDSGTRVAQFTVSLSAGSASTVSVAYATANGTATAGSDYVSASGTLSFSPGSVQRTVSVSVNGDTLLEPDETFFVNLSSPTGALIADGQGLGTIVNDDAAPLPSLSINDIAVTEGNAGTVNARFTVSLSASSSSTVTVAYATANGTATAGSDYVAKSGTLTFAAGTTQQYVDVTVNGDTTVESNETFFVNLASPSGATVADGQGQATIVNDDGAPPPALSINDVTVTEGNSGTVNARFTVSLSATSTSTVTVAYATASGTAAAGSDYVAKSGTLTFAAGTTQQYVDVTVNGDTTVESNETFFVNLSNPSGATIADGQGQGTITNDDSTPPPVPGVSVNDVTVAEGNSGTANARFTVSLSTATTVTVTVAYATANGTATAGSDYAAKSGTLTFAAGTTQQYVDVTVNGDTTVEPNETFFVNLSNPSRATITDGQGQGTITNDDTTHRSGVPGDFDGDGQGDLLWHHRQTGEVYTWLMRGTTAASGKYLTPSRVANTSWQIRGIADFNGDGRSDILWHNQQTGDLYVWFLDGTVTTSAAYLNPQRFTNMAWKIRATVDFNKDGKADILWHNQQTGDLYVWFMDGVQKTSGSYLTPSRFGDTRWQLRATLDANQDGEPDLLWHHQQTGDLYLWFLKGTTAVSGIYLTPSRVTDTKWQVVRACDFNSDGTVDLLWQHQTTGQLYIWLMSGTTATSAEYLNPPAVANASWEVMPQ